MRLSPRLAGLILGAGLLLGASAAHALSVQQVIEMHQVGVPANIIVNTVEASEEVFRLTPEQIIELRQAGVPTEVVEAMQATDQAQEVDTDEARRLDDPAVDTSRDDTQTDEVEEDDEDEGMIRTRRDTTTESETRSRRSGRQRVPDELRALKDRYDGRSYMLSSAGFFIILDQDRYPDHEVYSKYYLADSLFKMRFFHAAESYFLEVVREDPGSVFAGAALQRLVVIADEIGDNSDLLRVINEVPEEEYPTAIESELHYLAGLRAFEEEDYTAALDHLEVVSERSTRYLQSLYIQGVINNQRDRLQAAHGAFGDIIRYVSRRENVDAGSQLLADKARINLARIRFGLGQVGGGEGQEQYELAERHYLRVPRESEEWLQSRFELAWTYFHQDSGQNRALGEVMTADAPFFEDTSWLPENDLLRAFTYYQLCEFDTVETILEDFEGSYRPVLDELDTFLQPYRDREREPEVAYRQLYGLASDYDALPGGMFASIESDNSFQGPHQHVLQIEDELELIEAMRPQWRDSEIGRALDQRLREDRGRYARRAGVHLVNGLNRSHQDLDRLLGQKSLLQFEVVNGQYTEYLERFRNPVGVGVDESIELSFATNPRYVFWPFNGEYWVDELGYYVFAEEGSCEQ